MQFYVIISKCVKFLGIFSKFSNFIFYLKTFKNKYKKNIKSARVPRGCDVARKATWQSHADPRSAPTWRIFILILYLFNTYKMGLQPSLDGKGY